MPIQKDRSHASSVPDRLLPLPAPQALPLPLAHAHAHPHPYDDHQDQASVTSSLVHLSRPSSHQPPSRNTSPFVDLAHPDRWSEDADEQEEAVEQDTKQGASQARSRQQHDDDDNDDDDLDAWDPTSPPSSDMPSDLHVRTAADRGKSHTPLLTGERDKYTDYASPHRPSLQTRRSTFRERDPELEARAATRKRYVYAACFLVLSLISFTIQTETAVYIQHNLKWNKAYCML